MVLFLIFIFGLIVGSFLNAVIFRLYKEESFLFGRSHCNYCKHELNAWDLIPVLSFIILGGRCRYCHKKISWQYPLIELTTALLFVLLVYNYGLRITDYGLWAQLVFVCFLIVIAVFDFKHYLILDKVVYPAFVLALIWSIVNGNIVNSLYGALLVAGFFGLQYYISDGRWIGFGDVKLGLFLGTLFGLKYSLIMLFIAYFLGAIVGLALVLTNRKKFSSKLPFGVFLSISGIIMLLYGNQITDWYFRLIGWYN